MQMAKIITYGYNVTITAPMRRKGRLHMERNKIAIHRRIYARWRFEISGICPYCLKEVEQLSEDARSIKSEHIVGGCRPIGQKPIIIGS